MKIFKKILVVLMILFLAIITIVPIMGDENEYYVDEKFVVNSLDVDIDIAENGAYHIQENYALNFHASSRGIYREIANDYRMNWENESGDVTTKRYYFPVTDISVTSDGRDELVDIEHQSDGTLLVIGNDNYNEPELYGEKNYQIEYTMQTSSIDNGIVKEAFFYNIVPNNWGTVFHNVTATIHLPKDTDTSKFVLRDCSGTEANYDIDTNNNTITIASKDTLLPHCGITGYLPLADDYFVYDSIRTQSPNFFMLIALALITLIVILVIRIIFGHKNDIVEVVGFKPPKGYNSAMAGYVIDDKSDINDILSLLFEWAHKGYITIEEKKSNKIYFYKNNEIDAQAPAFERRLFKKMFNSDKPQTPEDWAKRSVIEDVAIAQNQLKATDEINNLYDRKSVVLQGFSIVGIIITLSIFYLHLSSEMLYRQMSGAFSLVLVFVVAFIVAAGFYFISYALDKNRVKAKMNNILIWSLSFLAIALLVFLPMIVADSLGAITYPTGSYDRYHTLLLITTGLYTIVVFVSLINVYNIKKRTEYGKSIYGEVLGLRTFIKYAKEDELVMMQEENPSLYYDVLPYAFAFGLSKLWIKHFEKIKIPTSNNFVTYRATGFNNYYMMNRMMSNMTAIKTTALPTISTSTGGGSFSGGGASFSGGGGFGGGGGGSR